MNIISSYDGRNEQTSVSYAELDPQYSGSNIWELNYHEAAIFLEEGENNDKFNSHPRDRSALPAYLVTHNHLFYSLDLFASLLLLSLAIVEHPKVAFFEDVPVGVHGSIELFGLFIIGISIVMQFRWLGWKTFLKHKRSMVKASTWIILLVEAITVIIRNKTHLRFTRALRPIFLVDNRYLGGVRRFLRQILQSLSPIIEVLGLLLFTLILFTTLGYYLFSPNPDDPYFSSFSQSFVSLYVLLTTANFPDVMMPSYALRPWSAAFFIAYLAITLYFIMNLMLAIVFFVFSDIEKGKFKKLLLHKRRACKHAFRLLVTRSQPNHISFVHFQGLMKFFKPKYSKRDIYLLFKSLNRSKSGLISLEEFHDIYEMSGFYWKRNKHLNLWFVHLPQPFFAICNVINKLVTWIWFKFFVYLMIITNTAILLGRTLYFSSQGPASHTTPITLDQIICVAFYGVEALLKIIGLGITKYFKSGWNTYDFIVSALAIVGLLAEYLGHSFFYVIIFRPLRLLRLFRMKKRYRDVFQTMVLLLPRILSAILVIIIIYYFFAIIGMELFSGYEMENCCINTTVEQYYKNDNTTVFINYYYLNNFDNIFVAGVTLFELTIVNNWFIIMEGYAAVAGVWYRTFFMIFYLVMMVVMSVVVAFILEAFTFRMQYNQAVQDQDKDYENIHIQVALNKEELRFIYGEVQSIEYIQQYAEDLDIQNQGHGVILYDGVQPRTKHTLQQRMYEDQLKSWFDEEGDERLSNHSCLLKDEPDEHSRSNSPVPSSSTMKTPSQRHHHLDEPEWLSPLHRVQSGSNFSNIDDEALIT